MFFAYMSWDLLFRQSSVNNKGDNLNKLFDIGFDLLIQKFRKIITTSSSHQVWFNSHSLILKNNKCKAFKIRHYTDIYEKLRKEYKLDIIRTYNKYNKET